MANIKETFKQFISTTRVQVSEIVSQINEVLHIHNNEAAKYLIHARDSANGNNVNVVNELNEEIDSTVSTDNNEDKEIQEMAEQTFISLEQLASVATKECVIKHWNDYVQDVLKAFKDAIIYVPRCYEKHNVLENAIAIHKKVFNYFIN
jgi:lipid II:glycine glycyltransferase (peptidoglycan interpeptide bridge formation enzyme)